MGGVGMQWQADHAHRHLYGALADQCWEALAAFQALVEHERAETDGGETLRQLLHALTQATLALVELCGESSDIVARIYDMADRFGIEIRPLSTLLLEAHQAALACGGRGGPSGEDHGRGGH